MLNFESDYIEGAHPAILEKLIETNMQALSGYGFDEYSQSAKAKITAACNCPCAQITFVTGGTQTNQLVIDTILKPFQGVVAAKTGHVAVHEAGAIEATGHKVLEIPGIEGKIQAEALDKYLTDFYNDGNHEHMVFPGMVYISFPTEYGTLYSKKELQTISEICHKNKLPLYIDGARLGYGLTSTSCDVSLPELAALCDVFYIGGTKCGGLSGEAIVFTKNNEPEHFATLVKQHGALLAKGRLNGVQFDTLFTGGLYFEISKNANLMAEKMKQAFVKKGYKLFINPPTNQQFVILENTKIEKLSKKVKFCFWEKIDEEHTAVRFATSWATTNEKIEQLIALL